jgi:hypothetical protein
MGFPLGEVCITELWVMACISLRTNLVDPKKYGLFREYGLSQVWVKAETTVPYNGFCSVACPPVKTSYTLIRHTPRETAKGLCVMRGMPKIELVEKIRENQKKL